ncbi:hypothetical protein B0O80DRAFT_445053 [Mortierella sp. GBAus27b]|nr:hypothetical protein B0O80DRAFT_445053 [Mortierella sp. GBAus27b]
MFLKLIELRADKLIPFPFVDVQLRAHSSAMTRFAGSKKEEFERIKRHHQAFEASSWNHQVMEPEARVCLIINRFTQSLIVMYASSACEKVFHVDPDHLTGRPLLLFVRADDLGSFVEQVEIIKTSSAITQMRFWFQSPNWPQEIPCEAIIFGAADGIVAVVRKCRPFIRKRFITSRDHFGTITRESSWSTSTWSRSRNSSPAASSVSPSPSPSPPNYGGFVSNGKTPSPIRDLPMSVLNQIRIVELNDEHLRPLTDIPEDDPSLVHEATAALEIPGFKEVILHDYDDGDDSSDDDYDDYDGVENVRRFKRMSISQKGHGP